MKMGVVFRLGDLGPARWRDWLDYPGIGITRVHEDELIAFLQAWTAPPEDWTKYVDLGAAQADEDELVALLVAVAGPPEDDGTGTRVSVHAWRALGQMRSEKAIPALLRVLEQASGDDWVCEDLPTVFGLIGPRAIAPLAERLQDRSEVTLQRLLAGEGLSQIGRRWEASRCTCVEAIAAALERYESEPNDLNSLLIGNLAELGDPSTVPLVREVFEARRTEPYWDEWVRVQVELEQFLEGRAP